MRLLIAVGKAASDAMEIPTGVSTLVNAASEILVLSPSLVGPLAWLTGEVDEARRTADHRLEEALSQLESTDASVAGMRGDELLRGAFDRAFRDFAADHVLIAVAASNRRIWQRQDVLTHLLDHYGVPVTIFAMTA